MPTISQLPEAATSTPADEVLVSQSGVTRSMSVGELLAGTQPAILIPSATLLGRVSLGPGGPETVSVSTGLSLSQGLLSANGSDHATYPLASSLSLTDNILLNSAGAPKQLSMPLLRGLYAPGQNITIDQNGTISTATDPSIVSTLSTLSNQVTQVSAAAQAASNLVTAMTPLAGGTMTGALTLALDPGLPLQAATKRYVDGVIGTEASVRQTAVASLMPVAGGTMTGALTLATDPTSNLQAATKHYTDISIAAAALAANGGSIANVLPLAGGTLTGLLTLSSNPTATMHAATKQYTDAATAPLATAEQTGNKNQANGYAGLNASKQMTADASPAPVLAAGSTQSRNLSTRSADIINVLDYGAIGDGQSHTMQSLGFATLAAAQAVYPAATSTNLSDDANWCAFKHAFAALPASGGAIYVPKGTYAIGADPAWSNKPVKLYGDGMGKTVLMATHTANLLTISQNTASNHVEVRDISFQANASGATAIGLQLLYPDYLVTGSYPFQTCQVEHIEFRSNAANNGQVAASFTIGLDIYGAWAASVHNARAFMATNNGVPITGNVGFRFARSIGIIFDDCQCYGADFAFQLNQYAEGISLINPRIVGANTGLGQSNYTPVDGNGNALEYYCDALYVYGGEFDVQTAAITFNRLVHGWIHGCRFAARQDGAALSLVSLTHATNTSVMQCVFLGNAATAAMTGISINGVLSYSVVVAGNSFGLLHNPVVLGAGTTNIIVRDNNASAQSGVNNVNGFIDNGLNDIQWTPGAGTLGVAHDWTLAGSAGNPLLWVANPSSAVNGVQVVPATTGNGPSIQPVGSDTNIPLMLRGKGSAGVVVNDTLKVSGIIQMLTAGDGILEVASPVMTAPTAQSWVPALAFSGTTAGLTYSQQRGSYYKLGPLVFYSAQLQLTSKGTSQGNLVIAGLPGGLVAQGAVCLNYYAGLNNVSGALYGTMDGSANIIVGSSNGTASTPQLYDTEIGNNFWIQLSGWYAQAS